MVESEGVQVRKARLDDMEKIEVLLQELLGNPLVDRRKFFIDALSSENYTGLLAEMDEEVVGYVDLWGFPDPGHGAMLGIILNYIVTKDQRRRGIGNVLMEAAVTEAVRRDFKELHVWTDIDNEAAKRMYRKYGFVKESLVLEREFN